MKKGEMLAAMQITFEPDNKGIEKEVKYFDIACRRIEDEQPRKLPPNAESCGALAHPTRTPGYRAGTETGER